MVFFILFFIVVVEKDFFWDQQTHPGCSTDLSSDLQS